MKKRIVIALLAGFAVIASAHAVEKPKPAGAVDYPFWTSPKRGHVGQLVPGLNAVLQLTDAQREQIAAARQEMLDNEAVKSARRISKSDPTVTAEQREAARATVEAATEGFRGKVAAVLTSEQKDLIGKINAAYAAAVEEVGIVYADKFASVKADQAARRRIQDEKNQDTEDQFLTKLDGILTAAQKEAMERAGEEEEHRDAKAASTKKAAQ
jgi:hypothetical protein